MTLRDEFGRAIAGPFGAEFTGAFWQEYSAETIASHRGDVILLDMRAGQPPADDMRDTYPLWAQLPEVQAGQIAPWYVPASYSHTRDAEFLESLAAAINGADDLVPSPES